MSFYVSTATFFLLHCDEWDHVVALPRHKFVTGATLLQLGDWAGHTMNVVIMLIPLHNPSPMDGGHCRPGTHKNHPENDGQ